MRHIRFPWEEMQLMQTNERTNGRTKWIPLGLGVVLLGFIAGGLYYIKAQGLVELAANSPQAQPSISPSASPSVSPTSTDVPLSAVSPNPSGSPAAAVVVDLTTDANGLSKTLAVIKTEKGEIRLKFYSQDAPNTVKRIIELIQKGFYNGLTFHRIVPGFVIQGGDPLGNGTGGSGQKLKAEFNSRRHVEGSVAMARASDPDSADSQFYISLGTHPHLDHQYTIFGQVISGMEVVQRIQAGDKMLSVTLE